ncbi:Uncharacterised protein [Achromobacter spanius]|jgi:hypothetical protein|uniref:sel1 repeat family protein n=1 Tax=Achromobacter TaxID=222 RepID=UPI000C2BF206|nr:sel1 repeat family protein [Achromobacter spanius]AUA58603.1 hypothetical protein CVS48_22875 [Achromobacter spanius]CAB3657086.1 hypothetical protein LMG5911_02756 [Achromobacter spanius]SPT41891.1 Uncharacterised protein [Achromobacter denitrificans]VEE59265.1 Uncharacterised protein [Achromobacter spanius]
MTRKSLFISTLLLIAFTLLVALFWRHQFAHTAPSLRGLIEDPVGSNAHVYGESPREDAQALRALLADAQRGNPEAQFMQGLMLEQVDMKEALRWYETAAAQGHEASIERLAQLRGQAAAR